MDISKPTEIRGHARGGQGMVTAFEMLAKIFSYRYNFEVQAFPFFGVERTGAPIQAYLRISPDTILSRNYIYQPDLIVVFDEGLITQTPVFNGLNDDGAILINSEQPPAYYKGNARQIYTVPATRISVDKKLGSRSLPIVNAAMAGAMLKILGADIQEAKDIIGEEVPSKPETNIEVAQIAFGEVHDLIDDQFQPEVKDKQVPANSTPDSKVPFWDKPMSNNKTGNWRVIAPIFENREAPCSDNCPAGTEVRKFIQLSSEGKFEESYQTIYKHNPFPAICGRVCPHFCQQNCNRIVFDDKVNIGAIERFIGDQHASYPTKPEPVIHPEKIAVVGSGPAGLTAALRLRNLGYAVTVFEAMPKAGGMMRSGIPVFRLPADVIDAEVEKIRRQGVEIITNKKVTIHELDGDFNAIITAVGSHIGTGLRLENEDGAIDGIEFLRALNIDKNQTDIQPGDKTAVIGGGNTAVDVARTALRLGAIPTIYYRRTQQEMPAIAEEVEEALKEGVEIEFLTSPVDLRQSENGQFDLTIQKMKLGEPDDSGRRRPVPIEGSEQTIRIDKLVKAIGQRSDNYVFADQETEARQGLIESGISTPVFCAGDMAWGGTVVEAIGSGNDVAREVKAHLTHTEWEKPPKSNGVATSEEINFTYYLPTPGTATPLKYLRNLSDNFEEVATGLSREEVVKESSRCLNCGDCFSCGNCLNYCPDAAIFIDEENRLRIDYDYCKGCGICVRECPSSAVRYTEERNLF